MDCGLLICVPCWDRVLWGPGPRHHIATQLSGFLGLEFSSYTWLCGTTTYTTFPVGEIWTCSCSCSCRFVNATTPTSTSLPFIRTQLSNTYRFLYAMNNSYIAHMNAYLRVATLAIGSGIIISASAHLPIIKRKPVQWRMEDSRQIRIALASIGGHHIIILILCDRPIRAGQHIASTHRAASRQNIKLSNRLGWIHLIGSRLYSIKVHGCYIMDTIHKRFMNIPQQPCHIKKVSGVLRPLRERAQWPLLLSISRSGLSVLCSIRPHLPALCIWLPLAYYSCPDQPPDIESDVVYWHFVKGLRANFYSHWN